MAVYTNHLKTRNQGVAVEHFQLPRLLQWQNILAQERSLLTRIRLCCPLPVFGIAPEAGISKGRTIARFVFIPLYRATTMVEMQVGEKHIGNLRTVIAGHLQSFIEVAITMQIVVGEEFFILLIAHAGVDKNEAIPAFYQQAAHGPGAKVALIGRVERLPERFRHHAEHGAAVELEMPGVDHAEFHFVYIGVLTICRNTQERSCNGRLNLPQNTIRMRVHLIAIGGSAMHNLALALKEAGHTVSGSDDEIFEPSKTRLAAAGLLPEAEGWFPEKIHAGLDAVILGMHARNNNPELLKAQELGLPIYSYPGYLYEESRDKTRVVIGGSHGKTSITAMVLHVLSHAGMPCDFLVGAQLKGFDTMVKVRKEVPRILLEGDEYLASALEPVPKFHLYKPHIALLSGVAWDHINVFPTFENYVEQFRLFVDKIEPNGQLFYYAGDPELQKIAQTARPDIRCEAYDTHPHEIDNGITYLLTEGGKVPLLVFGRHNLQNIEGARKVCLALGLGNKAFYAAIGSFSGAARRLELVYRRNDMSLFKDFAHSPSKLKATTEAVREQFPGRRLIACMELHTFSSLNARFLEEYKGSMAGADQAYVYFNPHTVAHKKLENISEEQVKQAFGTNNVEVFSNSASLLERLKTENYHNSVLLMMSSGNFDGLKYEELPSILQLS